MSDMSLEQAEYVLGSPEAYAKFVSERLMRKINWTQRLSVMGVDVVMASIYLPVLLRENGFPSETWSDGNLFALILEKMKINPEGKNECKYVSNEEAEAYWNKTMSLNGIKPIAYNYVSLAFNQCLSLGFSNYTRSSSTGAFMIYPLTGPLIKSMDRGWFYYHGDNVVLGVVFEGVKIYGKCASPSGSEFNFCIHESEANEYFSDEMRV